MSEITNNPSVPSQVVAEVHFPKFMTTLGIIPTSYKDSMSYYECLAWLCKYLEETVIPTVNQNGSAVEELQNLYIQLNSYVTHYFDNLDVSTEINNKLDSMVQSGELQILLTEQYQALRSEVNASIDSFENQVNNQLDNFETEVNGSLNQLDTRITGVASGSPLKATSTSGMTDTSRIYVNTTDGYWYYYDGSSWVQGGVYQATNLGNGSVHFQNLDTTLQTNEKAISSITNIEDLTSGMVKPDGTIQASETGIAYYEFAVTPFDVYKLHILYSSFLDANVAYQLLNDTTVVSNVLKTGVTITDNFFDVTLSIPTGVNKLRINTRKPSNALNYGSYIVKISSYKAKNISKGELDPKLQTFFKDVYEDVTDEIQTFISDAYLFSGSSVVQSYANSDVMSYAVTEGDKLKISVQQLVTNPSMFLCTNNVYTEKSVNDNTYKIYNAVQIIKSETSNYHFDDYEITIPEGVNKIYINKYKSDSTFKVLKATSYKINESDIVFDIDKVGFNKVIAIGDSLTEKNYRALYNYLDYIKEDIPSLTIQNLGVSGTGYYDGGGSGTNQFVTRIGNISSYDLDEQIVIVMGSINDVGSVASHLGELGDTTTDTIYGAMYNFYSTLFSTLNGVRVGCISPLNWKNSDTNADFTLYLKALEDTCKLFNIPYLDLHDKTNLRPNNSTFLNTYYEADGTGSSSQIDENGVHPNSLGHKLIYGRIKDFICSL